MKKLRITAALLEDLNACGGGIDRFRSEYPRGVIVTDDQEANFPLVIEALARGLNVGFFAENLYEDTSARLPDDYFRRYARPPYVADPSNGLLWGSGEDYANEVANHHACGNEFGYAGWLADAVGVYLSKHPKAEWKGR